MSFVSWERRGVSGCRGFEWRGVKGGEGSAEGVYRGGVAVYTLVLGT